MDFGSLDSGAHLIVEIGAVLGAIAAVLLWSRKVWRWFKERLKDIRFMFHHRQESEAIKDKIDRLIHNIEHNGGSSVMDALQRIEERQEFSHAFMRTQMNTAPKALFETDAKGRVVWVNRRFTTLTGFQPHELLGWNWVNLIEETERESTEHKWIRAVTQAREFTENLTYVRHTGEGYPVFVHAYTVKSPKNELLGYIGEVTLTGDEDA